jgi:cytochrome c553
MRRPKPGSGVDKPRAMLSCGTRRIGDANGRVPSTYLRRFPNKDPSTLLYSAQKRISVLRTLQSFLLVGVVCTAAALLPGCSSSDPATTGGAGAPGAGGATGGAGAGTAGAGTAGGGAAGSAPLVGDATRGKAAMTSKSCNSCHGEDGSGMAAAGPNITGSKLPGLGGGIGNWTEAQFHDAVRLAKNIDGKQLCLLMAPFPAMPTGMPGSIGVSDQDIADLYVYLEAQMATMALQGGYCPTG